jgi:aminoglycoside N3'-acetyltransferase
MHAASHTDLAWDLARLGVREGDTIMVHASLKAVGPVEGGPETIVAALLDAVGPAGNLLAYVSWDRSPYEESLNGLQLSEAERAAWPPFDPRVAGTYRDFGLLNAFICQHPGAERSEHPDASMAAIGPRAAELVHRHELGHAYGPGSPLERFIGMDGKVLLLGAPLGSVTVLHYAEAVANIPNKRRVNYEMPVLDPSGRKVWTRVDELDSNGILHCFAIDGQPDAVERIATDYARLGRYRFGRVAKAECYLFEASPLVEFGIRWLERKFGSAKGRPFPAASSPSSG